MHLPHTHTKRIHISTSHGNRGIPINLGALFALRRRCGMRLHGHGEIKNGKKAEIICIPEYREPFSLIFFVWFFALF